MEEVVTQKQHLEWTLHGSKVETANQSFVKTHRRMVSRDHDTPISTQTTRDRFKQGDSRRYGVSEEAHRPRDTVDGNDR